MMLLSALSPLRRFVVLVALVAAGMWWGGTASAQQQSDADSYRFDFGLGIGASGYLGDANQSNLYSHPGFAAYASARYLFDTRWALRANLGTASLKGNTADLDNFIPTDDPISFSSQVYDLSVRGEVNFFNYGIGETYRRLRRWTPFLSVGAGVALAAVDGRTYTAMTIPMGFGFKFKLRPRFNLEACFTMTKTFSDHLDGANLSDLYLIKSSFLKNTDWFSTFTVGFTYEFGKRCAVCHRID